ncbi:signal peptidase I [mine drainage metagenome]|uniref:Signal peptidase I n=1 Tax=mine drainage metagenome TaxID=410659 RepID=A0A1J5S4H3_9ZZZZ
MMFALFMIVILVVTGLIWIFDILVLRKNRPIGADEPILVEYAKSFFPVILVVFLVRSFVVEPFKIPSGSMMPTLLAGDYILVNKFTYGLRVPILNNTFLAVNHPKRGDVFVFHYPPDPSIDYIKRVVGLPGDKIRYQDKHLTINGKPLEVRSVGDYEYVMSGLNIMTAKEYSEQLGTVKHDILIHDVIGNYDANSIGMKFANNEEVVVPAGHYFAMGDNRDNSSDGRVWGFVPENNLVGKAFFIWMNFDQGSRIGSVIH